MDNWRSIRSSSRARTSERGFALALALIVAVLYFGLMQLMLWDASRELAEARRFRARVIALTYAENGAEQAALHIGLPQAVPVRVDETDDQGEFTGILYRNAPDDKGAMPFRIEATGKATGVTEVSAKVSVYGVVEAKGALHIYNTLHTQ